MMTVIIINYTTATTAAETAEEEEEEEAQLEVNKQRISNECSALSDRVFKDDEMR